MAAMIVPALIGAAGTVAAAKIKADGSKDQSAGGGGETAKATPGANIPGGQPPMPQAAQTMGANDYARRNPMDAFHG